MARALMIYDALNHITLHGVMTTFVKSETSMLWDSFRDMNLNSKDILVFDRSYASHLLFSYLHKLNVQFCFRMKKHVGGLDRFSKSGKISDVISMALPLKYRTRQQNRE